MFLMSLDYPLNIMEFFGGLFPLIAFDILPVDLIYELNWFNINALEARSLSEQFEIVGYETTFTIFNLGSLFVMIVSMPFVTLILGFVRVVPCLCTFVRKKIDRYFKLQFWNGIILFVDSVYLVLVFVAMVGLYDLRMSNDYTLIEKLQSLMAIGLFVICLAFPAFVTLLYAWQIKSSKILPDFCDSFSRDYLLKTYGTDDPNAIRNYAYTRSRHSQFLEKYGVLIKDYRLEQIGKTKSIAILCFQIIRKLFFSVSVLVFLRLPFIGIFTVYITVIANIVIFGFYSPMVSKTD